MALSKNPRTAETFINRALDAFNAGFTSKAAQQQALKDLNTAYDYKREQARSAQLTAAPAWGEGETFSEARHAHFDADDFPYDLHQVRDRHLPSFDKYGVDSSEIKQLIELRATIKAAPVNAPAKREPTVYEVKARETIQSLMERRKAQYLNAIELGHIFGGLPVSANNHWVVNEHGTQFIRTFWYLAGKLTPLNIIIAAAEALERE